MRDFARLREHLRSALFCVPLALPACGGTQQTSSSEPVSTTVIADKDGPPGPPSHVNHMPHCPTGDFCASKETMKPYAAKDSETKLGCPVDLDSAATQKDKPHGMPEWGHTSYLFAEQKTVDARKAGDKSACCYEWHQMCPGGRPLLDGEQAIVADVRPGDGWSKHAPKVRVDGMSSETRARLAHAWLADARAEHASIASFARTTMELLAAGAPAELVADAQRAGLDEVRHAQRCFELAARYGGSSVEPGSLPPLAPRATDPLRLAHDTFVEGCVAETISALCALRAAADAPEEIAPIWSMIAADETRHAALAWRTMAWLVAQHGAGVLAPAGRAAAEMQAVGDARGEARPALPVEGRSPLNNTDEAPLPGRLGTKAIAAARRDAWREVILPTLAALGA